MEAIKYKINPLFLETKSQRVQILARPSTMKKIKQTAKENKKSINDMINRILEDYISKKPEKFNLENEMKKLEVKEFQANKSNFFLIYEKYICNAVRTTTEIPFVTYFTLESIQRFLEIVNEQKITKEEFLTAYKNVFGGKNAD